MLLNHLEILSLLLVWPKTPACTDSHLRRIEGGDIAACRFGDRLSVWLQGGILGSPRQESKQAAKEEKSSIELLGKGKLEGIQELALSLRRQDSLVFGWEATGSDKTRLLGGALDYRVVLGIQGISMADAACSRYAVFRTVLHNCSHVQPCFTPD